MILRLSALLFLLLSLNSTSNADQLDKLREQFRTGYKLGEYEAAFSAQLQITKLAEQPGEVWYDKPRAIMRSYPDLAELSYVMGRYDVTMSSCDRVTRMLKEQPKMLDEAEHALNQCSYVLAAAYLKLKRYDDALREISKVTYKMLSDNSHSQADEGEPPVLWARIFLEAGKYSEAAQQLERAWTGKGLDYDVPQAEISLLAGHVAAARGDSNAAAARYTEAIDLVKKGLPYRMQRIHSDFTRASKNVESSNPTLATTLRQTALALHPRPNTPFTRADGAYLEQFAWIENSSDPSKWVWNPGPAYVLSDLQRAVDFIKEWRHFCEKRNLQDELPRVGAALTKYQNRFEEYEKRYLVR